jgi:hypothetical protein
MSGCLGMHNWQDIVKSRQFSSLASSYPYFHHQNHALLSPKNQTFRESDHANRLHRSDRGWDMSGCLGMHNWQDIVKSRQFSSLASSCPLSLVSAHSDKEPKSLFACGYRRSCSFIQEVWNRQDASAACRCWRARTERKSFLLEKGRPHPMHALHRQSRRPSHAGDKGLMPSLLGRAAYQQSLCHGSCDYKTIAGSTRVPSGQSGRRQWCGWRHLSCGQWAVGGVARHNMMQCGLAPVLYLMRDTRVAHRVTPSRIIRGGTRR